MKTNIHFWSYLALFLLEGEIFRTEAVEKIKKHILCSISFFPKIVPFMRECEKNRGTARQTTDDNTICHMCFACRITKVTKTHTRARTRTHNTYYLLPFHCNSGCMNTPQCLVYTHIACLVYKSSPARLMENWFLSKRRSVCAGIFYGDQMLRSWVNNRLFGVLLCQDRL
jgi:hypothetical protein